MTKVRNYYKTFLYCSKTTGQLNFKIHSFMARKKDGDAVTSS